MNGKCINIFDFIRKKALLFLLLFQSYICSAQRDSITLSVLFSNTEISSDTGFTVRIYFISKSPNTISIPLEPTFTDFANDFGQVRFKLEKLYDSCFKTINVTTDILNPDFNIKIKKIKPFESTWYEFDIRNI
jgi:hypothetical protein